MSVTENTLLLCQSPYGLIKFNELNLFNGLKKSYRLYIDDGLQWDSSDEYRYHQSLFAMPFLFMEENIKKDILVLGGGDGLGVRELLSFEDEINSITLVDISKEMLFLAQNNEIFLELNKNSLNHSKVTVINDDAQNFIKKTNKKFDIIIHSLPSPVINDKDFINYYYSSEFFEIVLERLKPNGIFNINALSPLFLPNAMNKIMFELLKFAKNILLLNVDINSIGLTSFILAKKKQANWEILRNSISDNLFFSLDTIDRLFEFHKDEKKHLPYEEIKKNDLLSLIKYDLNI